MADDLASELSIGKDRIVVLPNPVDLDAIRAATRAACPKSGPWSGPGPHLLAVGRLAPEKGFDLLLQALVAVRQRFPATELLIAGAGPEETALKTQYHSLGLETAVRFAGHVHSPYGLYAGASLFVLSSRHEGMSNALLEAAVAGLPIVSTPASGGIVDLLHTLEGAWLAQEISAGALASALLEALGQLGPEQRFQRSFPRTRSSEDQGSPLADEFAFESALERYEELIDSACAGPEPKHVALVIPTLDRLAGAERHVMLLARGLRTGGWQVSVVALAGSGGTAAIELAGADIAFLSLGMRKGLADPRGWMRFIQWLRRARPDVVHAHLPHAAWLARWSRLCAPVPVLVDTLHSSSTGTMGRRLGYRVSRRLPDQVTAVSRSVADSHRAARMVDAKTLAVLHNGVDVAAWLPDEAARIAVHRELGLTDEFLWFAAGRLDAVKDYPTLLKAMAAVALPAHLIVAGDGPLLRELTDLALRLGLGSRVHFLGFVPEAKRWFQAGDALVLSSRWEGLPTALLEAAACGLPAVATDVPGSRDVILNGDTGLLVPPMDPPALAAAMNTMMQMTQEERRTMGLRARQRAVEHFDLAATLDRYEELYCDLFRKSSRGCAPLPFTRTKRECSSPAGSRDLS
jgi:glycosyltransferase involved in cell wall biosynthesis